MQMLLRIMTTVNLKKQTILILWLFNKVAQCSCDKISNEFFNLQDLQFNLEDCEFNEKELLNALETDNFEDEGDINYENKYNLKDHDSNLSNKYQPYCDSLVMLKEQPEDLNQEGLLKRKLDGIKDIDVKPSSSKKLCNDTRMLEELINLHSSSLSDTINDLDNQKLHHLHNKITSFIDNFGKSNLLNVHSFLPSDFKIMEKLLFDMEQGMFRLDFSQFWVEDFKSCVVANTKFKDENKEPFKKILAQQDQDLSQIYKLLLQSKKVLGDLKTETIAASNKRNQFLKDLIEDSFQSIDKTIFDQDQLFNYSMSNIGLVKTSLEKLFTKTSTQISQIQKNITTLLENLYSLANTYNQQLKYLENEPSNENSLQKIEKNIKSRQLAILYLFKEINIHKKTMIKHLFQYQNLSNGVKQKNDIELGVTIKKIKNCSDRIKILSQDLHNLRVYDDEAFENASYLDVIKKTASFYVLKLKDRFLIKLEQLPINQEYKSWLIKMLQRFRYNCKVLLGEVKEKITLNLDNISNHFKSDEKLLFFILCFNSGFSSSCDFLDSLVKDLECTIVNRNSSEIARRITKYFLEYKKSKESLSLIHI